MLINALCQYYDLLAGQHVLPTEGWMSVDVDCKICIDDEGKITDVVDIRKEVEVTQKGGKVARKKVSSQVLMPKRTEKSAVDVSFIEHRSKYIFGLVYASEDKQLVLDTTKGDPHSAFKEKTKEYIKNLDNPCINAFRKFVENWDPERELGNLYLKSLGAALNKFKFVFCLSSKPNELLHEVTEIRNRWDDLYSGKEDGVKGISALSGEEELIAKVHGKIKGVANAYSSGAALVCVNNQAEESYGKRQGYNCNISEKDMLHYSSALNYLLRSPRNHKIIDGTTIVYWAMDLNGEYETLFDDLISGSEKITEDELNYILHALVESIKKTTVDDNQIREFENLNRDIPFYVVGIKPNQAVLSVRFIYENNFGQILKNIAKYNREMSIGEKKEYITPLWKIKRSLVSPNNEKAEISSALVGKLFQSIVLSKDYPSELYQTVIRRIKIDHTIKYEGDKAKRLELSRERAGMVKAYLNRNLKEEYGMSLDNENRDAAYLCGRAFAVIEKAQEEASDKELNRTIKDTYFASAMTKPASVMPKLIKLNQYHLRKIEQAGRKKYLAKMLGIILDSIKGDFPVRMEIKEQGKFILGYYHQRQSFFVKK